MAKPAWQLRPDPVQGLDRWLLGRLALIGSATVVEFAESPSTQTAGGDELRLTPQEVENWLRSAEAPGAGPGTRLTSAAVG